jgi:NAD dependent epimerase/dehydratase family enzyme
MQGIYNAVAPETITNNALTLALAKKMRGQFFIPMHVPAFLLKIILGEMSIEVLKSATVNSFKTQSAGFHFNYPTIDLALGQLCNK